MRLVLHILTLVVCAALAIGYAGEWASLGRLIWRAPLVLRERWFFGALVASIPVLWGLRRRLQFFSTFEHEMTHILVGLLFFKKPSSLQVSESGQGMVSMSGRNFLIVLAPYFLPTISLLLLPLWWVVDRRFENGFFAVLGLSLGYHLVSTWEETGNHQTDIKSSGVLFSYVVLIAGNLLFLGAVVAFALRPPGGLLAFVAGGPEAVFGWIRGFGR